MNAIRIVIGVMAGLLLALGITAYYYLPADRDELDVSVINDIVKTLGKQWENEAAREEVAKKYDLDYVILDSSGETVFSTRDNLSEDIWAAVANRDTIVNIEKDGQIIGQLAIYNNTSENWMIYRNRLLMIIGVFILFTGIFVILVILQIRSSIIRPFRELELFARNVAAGELDAPLEMDEHNQFGAFTESFDLMREELSKAREEERKANQSKKELVASLSHDIKTPVASIQAVAEVMSVKSDSAGEQRQLAVIGAKAEQINVLITNMFHATMEELQELHVQNQELSSSWLYEVIERADYNKKTDMCVIPGCIIQADPVRLEQVIDNIIGNSYKYAGTTIQVESRIVKDNLELIFQDWGPGITEEERILIFQKYYRGKETKELAGTGLGLYISRYLMEKMEGNLILEKSEVGFRIKMQITLAR